MGEFLDVFFGSSQSLYASYAILAAIITICVTIMLTGTDIPMANRFLFVFLTILMLLPSVFLILFQITCMVTGGTKDTRWWCWLYAWIVAAFIIIYCIFVIIISFSSLFTYSNAVSKIDIQDATNKVSPEVSNEYARKVMVEQFEAEMMREIPSPKKDDENRNLYNNLPQDPLSTNEYFNDMFKHSDTQMSKESVNNNSQKPKELSEESPMMPQKKMTQESSDKQKPKELPKNEKFMGTLSYDDNLYDNVEAFSNDNEKFSAF
jgi:nitrogen fixation/metabolism regulation signal transduction histidine kinase